MHTKFLNTQDIAIKVSIPKKYTELVDVVGLGLYIAWIVFENLELAFVFAHVFLHVRDLAFKLPSVLG